jgi:hypothetical protein
VQKNRAKQPFITGTLVAPTRSENYPDEEPKNVFDPALVDSDVRSLPVYELRTGAEQFEHDCHSGYAVAKRVAVTCATCDDHIVIGARDTAAAGRFARRRKICGPGQIETQSY